MQPREHLQACVDHMTGVSIWSAPPFTGISFTDKTGGPKQGWKLHVSASVRSADDVLNRVLPVLLRNRVDFKVVSTFNELAEMNSILSSLPQMGKFITIYPKTDDSAKQLAQELDEVTQGLAGPHIPTDRRLHPGSIVSYRYGGFTATYKQMREGNILSVLQGPDGEWVEDKREPRFTPPAWAVNPFAAIDGPSPTASQGPLGTRYRPLRVFKQAARGGVYLVEDRSSQPPRNCIVKEARAFIGQGIDTDEDIRDVVRQEYLLLKELEGNRGVVKALDLFEQEGNLYIVREAVEGSSLGSVFRRSKPLAVNEVWPLVCHIGDLMVNLHNEGVVINDLSPGNFIIEPDGTPRLIDLEISYRVGAPDHPRYHWYTRGFESPRRAKRIGVPSPADDIYAFGRLIFNMLTSLSPDFAEPVPESEERLLRTLRQLRPDLPAAVVGFVGRCIRYEEAERFPSAVEMCQAAAEIGQALRQDAVVVSEEHDADTSYTEAFRDIAQAFGSWYLANAPAPEKLDALRPQPGTGYPEWTLHHGEAGMALSLRDLHVASGDERFLRAAAQLADWSAKQVVRTPYRVCPGLHMGFSGPAWLCLQVARATGETAWYDRAEQILAEIDPETVESSEITTGLAGIGFIHLELAHLSGRDTHWTMARRYGEEIVRRVQHGPDGPLWPYFDAGSPNGFAHGVAGIAYYLMESGRVLEDKRLLHMARACAEELGQTGFPSPETGGLMWNRIADNPEAGNWPWTWCNGTFGIGRFFLRAATVFGEGRYLDLAKACAESVARTKDSAHVRPLHQCCGVAGGVEFLLDMYEQTHDSHYRKEAEWWGKHLVLRASTQDGCPVWQTSSQGTLPRSYMAGSAGVISCLTRLSDPDSLTRPFALPLSGLIRRGGSH